MSERKVIARAVCKHRNIDSMVGYCVGVPGDDCAGDCAHFQHTDDFLAALDAAGKAVVPKEPTQSMINAAVEYTSYAADRVYPEDCVNVYHAMLAAAKEGER